jgi:hypothetical protein
MSLEEAKELDDSWVLTTKGLIRESPDPFALHEAEGAEELGGWGN